VKRTRKNQLRKLKKSLRKAKDKKIVVEGFFEGKHFCTTGTVQKMRGHSLLIKNEEGTGTLIGLTDIIIISININDKVIYSSKK